MKTGFLLGAGISIPAGLPSTVQLTEKILNIDNYSLTSAESFVRAAPHAFQHAASRRRRLVPFLCAIRTLCNSYFDAEKDRGRQANYEDLFYIASQCEEHLFQEYENPALEPLIAFLGLMGWHDRRELQEIAGLACRYLQDVVAIELAEGNATGHVKCLIDAASDLDQCDIFTLNHDTLIESSLKQARIRFSDGFGPPDGDVAWWNPMIGQRSRVRLLKLHGSLDWRYCEGHLAKFLRSDMNHARTSAGVMLNIPSQSDVLMGTFNKVRDYFQQPYFQITAAFRQRIQRLDRLFVSGYSFSDKGVNLVLVEWITGRQDRRIVVLAEEGRQCLEQARGAIRKLWNDHPQSFVFPGSYLSDSKWKDIRQTGQPTRRPRRSAPKSR